MYRSLQAAAPDGNQDTVVVDSSTGQPVSGCLVGWFSTGRAAFTDSSNAATTLPKDLAAVGYITGTTQVTMNDVGSPQDACTGVNIRLTVTAG